MLQLLLPVIYLSFISLGLPDSLLGSAWPTMYKEFSVPLSYSGIIFMIISAGTIVSSLQSDRLTRKLGTGKVTALSVLTTAVALFGFSISHSFIALCLWAIPYGLGAGSVDASINNFVALHYSSTHMSWLHCMWGVGASVGPYIMGFALTGGKTWNMGYRYISIIQIVLTAIILLSLPLWKTGKSDGGESGTAESTRALSMKEILSIPGAKQIFVAFFSYCAIEQTTSLWASSYMVLHHNLTADEAAGLASMFFIGITFGRFLCGFMNMKFNDAQMIRLGCAVILAGIVFLLLPFGKTAALIGLILVGLGCAPVYPSIIHSTPDLFGADKSQAVIGVQMASAYVGTCLMPPVFGLIANNISVTLLPLYLLLFLVLLTVMHGKARKISTAKNISTRSAAA